MRHATSAALDELEPLLERVRMVSWLVERKRGVFYRKQQACLHFHEDPAGLFADVRLTGDWERFRVQTQDEQDTLFRELNRVG